MSGQKPLRLVQPSQFNPLRIDKYQLMYSSNMQVYRYVPSVGEYIDAAHLAQECKVHLGAIKDSDGNLLPNGSLVAEVCVGREGVSKCWCLEELEQRPNFIPEVQYMEVAQIDKQGRWIDISRLGCSLVFCRLTKYSRIEIQQ